MTPPPPPSSRGCALIVHCRCSAWVHRLPNIRSLAGWISIGDLRCKGWGRGQGLVVRPRGGAMALRHTDSQGGALGPTMELNWSPYYTMRFLYFALASFTNANAAQIVLPIIISLGFVILFFVNFGSYLQIMKTLFFSKFDHQVCKFGLDLSQTKLPLRFLTQCKTKKRIV